MAVEVQEQRVESRLYYFKDQVEIGLAKALSLFGEKTKLKDACEYAMKSGGKRMRPLIVLLTADGLGNGLDATEGALAAEFFHIASLISDDLPCMDNDDERRSQPTVHKVFGETIAVLASYALITAGFEWLTKNGKTMRQASAPFSERADHITVRALEEAAHSAGICGATGGQFTDLFPQGKTFEALKETILKKTVTLFEMSFISGWLFGGGDEDRVEEVKQMARHFGMAFQIADDLGDQKQDSKKSSESNAALLLGQERALRFVAQELKLFESAARDLRIWSASFEKLLGLIHR